MSGAIVARKVREGKARERRKAAEERIVKIKAIFNRHDVDETGHLTKEQLATAIHEICGKHASEKELDFLFKVSDTKPPEGQLGWPTSRRR